MTAADFRQLRHRQTDLLVQVDRRADPPDPGTAAMVVQMYNGGAMPVTAPNQYDCYPVTVTGAELEGGAVTIAADGTRSLVVTFLTVPSVGGLYIARLIDGHWIAGFGRPAGGGGCDYGTDSPVCWACGCGNGNPVVPRVLYGRIDGWYTSAGPFLPMELIYFNGVWSDPGWSDMPATPFLLRCGSSPMAGGHWEGRVGLATVCYTDVTPVAVRLYYCVYYSDWFTMTGNPTVEPIAATGTPTTLNLFSADGCEEGTPCLDTIPWPYGAVTIWSVPDPTCDACSLCFLFYQCDSSVPLPGVQITVGDVTLTTDATGKACFTTPDPAFTNGEVVDWTASYTSESTGTMNWSGSKTLHCAGMNLVTASGTPNNTVTITVYNACNNVPPVLCVGASVWLQGGFTGTTNASGQVTFTNVPPGTWTLTVGGPSGTALSTTSITVVCYGAQDFTVDLYCTDRCSLVVTVTGCNGLPIQGASVSVGSLPAVQTDATGTATVYGIANGSQGVSVVCFPRFNTYTTTLEFSDCPNQQTLAVALTPAAGYTCLSCSAYPLADTVYLTDSVYGTATLTWTPASAAWMGTLVASYPGSSCCLATTFTLRFQFNQSDCSLHVSYHSIPGTDSQACPSVTGAYANVAGIAAQQTIVPQNCAGTPGFALVWGAPGGGCTGTNVIYSGGLGGVYSLVE